jgi:DNA-binding transcriptional ArsR family regulator
VHRLPDEQDVIVPDRSERYREILSAIGAGASSLAAISRLLPFNLPREALEEDLADLERHGLVRSRIERGSKRFFPVGKEEKWKELWIHCVPMANP